MLPPLSFVLAITLPAQVDFNRDVRPVLSDACFACHGPDAKTRKAGLRLDIREAALKQPGVLVPGKASASELMARLVHPDGKKRMPPEKALKKLTPGQIDILRRWIDEGAPYAPHWAFVPPARIAPPVGKGSNPIDAFVLARLEKERLKPMPPAERFALLRRASLDLTGLPPTPEEIEAFVKDTRPDSYERVVARLLASPRFGEHMGRYWLDLARFGDTHGLHLDNYREMWPYRDWVLRAFNDNKPYSDFVTEQLAGDLLPGGKLADLVATGFSRAHITTSEGGSITEEIHIRNVNDRVDTMGTAMLGLSIGCAKCHDHKYDPITQKDFYSLSAFFNSLEGNPMDGNAARHPPTVRVPGPGQEALLAAAEAKLAAARKALAEKTASLKYDESLDAKEPPKGSKPDSTLAGWLKAVKAARGKGLPKDISSLVSLAKPTLEQQRKLRDHYVQNVWPGGKQALATLRIEADKAQKAHAAIEASIPVTYVYKETPTPRPTFVLKRGEYDDRGAPVSRAVPVFLAGGKEIKNRLQLAAWMLSPQNPLTARVAVNHLWQRVFGTGLVKTSEDLGGQGEAPSHPELLDWLAIGFRDSGWDVKRMMRLLVTSDAYRRSSRLTKELAARDPENRLLARGPRHRLDAETLRDQALAVSGLLTERIGGPSVKPPQPPGLWKAVAYVSSNTANFVADTGAEKVFRRGVYTFWKRTAPPPQMSTFDAPSRESCSVRRERTNTPLQALLLLNDPQYVEASRVLAQHALEAKDDAERIVWMFRRATGRTPRAGEAKELAGALADLRKAYSADEASALKLVRLGETPASPVKPAELAAWTMLASTILNLDEVLNK